MQAVVMLLLELLLALAACWLDGLFLLLKKEKRVKSVRTCSLHMEWYCIFR